MSHSNNDITIKLMQNVSDKLDDILTNISESKGAKIDQELLLEQKDNFKTLIENQETINKNLCISKNTLKEILNENPTVVNQNHKSEYMIFGRDSPFSSKLLLALIFTVIVCIPMFKYVPEYLIENSSIKEERDNYKLFYDYVFLNEFDNTKTVPTDLVETLNIIKDKDSAFINYVHRLHSKYATHLKKENLKAELQKLQE